MLAAEAPPDPGATRLVGSWTQLSPTDTAAAGTCWPSRRHQHSAALVLREPAAGIYADGAPGPARRELVIIGGGGEDGLCEDFAWTLDLESMNWSETNISGKVFLPAASCATALCGDSLFAYGGVAQVDFNGRTTEAVGAGLYHISLSTNACTRIYPVRSIPPIPDVSIPPALLGASLLHVPSLSDPDPLKGRIYLFGGMDAGGIVNSDLWIFDLGGNRKEGWTRVRTPNSKDNMMWPGIRVGHQCALWIDRDEKDPHKRRRLVLHGGTAPPDAIPTQRRSDIWTLDIDAFRPSWSPVFEIVGAERLPARSYHSMHILGNKMIVAFGNTAKHDFDTRFASADDVWIFDLKTTLWQRVAGHGTPAPKAKNKEKQNAPAPRSGHASVLDGSNLLVFGGAVSHGQSAATSAELWSLPLGPPAPPSLPTITDISPDGFTAIWDDLYFEHTSKGYVLSYRMEDEAMEEGWGEWSQVHVPRGNEPRHSHRLDNLKFNTAYEFNLTAVGESGDSTWWGPLETREVWTQGPPEQPVILHSVPRKDHMKVVLAKPTRQSDSESADVTTEIMVRVRSVDLDEGQAAVLEPLEADGQHVQIAPPPKKSRKVHYSGISAFQPQQLAPEVVPHFTPLLSIPGLPTDVEIPFDLIKEAINPTSKALEKGTERVRELSEEYAVAVHEARVLALTEDLDDFQISPDPDPTVPPGVKKGPGRPAKFFLDASSLAAVEAKLPFSYEMKAYVAYEIRVRIKNQHGLSPVSRAAVFQRSVPIAVPIPWREPPQHDEHTLAIFQERQARRKAEEEEEERLRAEEEAVAAKALASLALGDGVDSEQEDTVRAKRPKTNPRASIATTVDGETKRKTPHPVEEPDSDPEEEFHKNSSASKSKDGLPDQFPFNLAYGEPIKVQFDKYRDAYECRALWYRKGYLQNAHDTTEKQEGWVLDVHCVGWGIKDDAIIFLNDEGEKAISPSTLQEQRDAAPPPLDPSHKQYKKRLEERMRFLNSRRYFRVKHREFLERSPEEYQITEDDVPLLKSGRPWIRDPHFTRKEKLHYVRNETQLGLILFDEGRKAVRR